MNQGVGPARQTDPLSQIASFEEALSSYPKEQFPVYHGMLQYRLGLAYLDLFVGDRPKNLRKALDALHEALTVFDRDGFAGEYARVQNSIGIVYRELPGDRVANLQRAIGCYQDALAVLDKEKRPQEYGATQNNLGLAYAELPRGDRAENLRRAMAAYNEALTVFTRDRFPRQYAATHYNLGLAHTEFPEGDAEENLRRAIQCYEEAIGAYMAAAAIDQTALVYNSLGIAWIALPGPNNLTKAIAAFSEALRVVRKAEMPAQYAIIKNNLGLAYVRREADVATDLRRAVGAFQEALASLDPDSRALERAQVEENLSRALGRLAEVGHPGTATDHLVALVAAGDDEEGVVIMREQVDHWTRISPDARQRMVAQWVDALLGLEALHRRKVVQREVHTLLERPTHQMEAVLKAHVEAVNNLPPSDQVVGRENLAQAAWELYGPQRTRVLDMLRQWWGEI